MAAVAVLAAAASSTGAQTGVEGEVPSTIGLALPDGAPGRAELSTTTAGTHVTVSSPGHAARTVRRFNRPVVRARVDVGRAPAGSTRTITAGPQDP